MLLVSDVLCKPYIASDLTWFSATSDTKIMKTKKDSIKITLNFLAYNVKQNLLSLEVQSLGSGYFVKKPDPNLDYQNSSRF